MLQGDIVSLPLMNLWLLKQKPDRKFLETCQCYTVVSFTHLWIWPRPRLPMTSDSRLSSPTASHTFSLGSPQYIFSTTDSWYKQHQASRPERQDKACCHACTTSIYRASLPPSPGTRRWACRTPLRPKVYHSAASPPSPWAPRAGSALRAISTERTRHDMTIFDGRSRHSKFRMQEVNSVRFSLSITITYVIRCETRGRSWPRRGRGAGCGGGRGCRPCGGGCRPPTAAPSCCSARSPWPRRSCARRPPPSSRSRSKRRRRPLSFLWSAMVYAARVGVALCASPRVCAGICCVFDRWAVVGRGTLDVVRHERDSAVREAAPRARWVCVAYGVRTFRRAMRRATWPTMQAKAPGDQTRGALAGHAVRTVQLGTSKERKSDCFWILISPGFNPNRRYIYI